MSEINERILAQCAAFDRTGSPEILREIRELEFQKRKREGDEEREQREARKAREAEAASTNWYAAVDTRIRTHFKDWAWAAIDERIQQWLVHEWENVLKD